MTTQITATEVWNENGTAAVQVQSLTSYQVTVRRGGMVHIRAPGLDREIELDEEFYPLLDDSEACAIMLVAQLEGGVIL